MLVRSKIIVYFSSTEEASREKCLCAYTVVGLSKKRIFEFICKSLDIWHRKHAIKGYIKTKKMHPRDTDNQW